jgi:hypothetical protein
MALRFVTVPANDGKALFTNENLAQMKQIVFPTGRMRIGPAKTHPEAARCWQPVG